MGKNLTKFFESYIETNDIFADRAVLNSAFTPENLPHRDDQIQQLADIIAPALKEQKASNVFIYGKTGTGKTVTVNYTTQQMEEVAAAKGIPFRACYVNCKLKKVADTEYRLIAELARFFGQEIPATGLPTDEVYKLFYAALEREQQTIIIILDEIDQLVEKCGDDILYNLTRIGTSVDKSKVSIIGISNNVLFKQNLDPRVVSSLGGEEIVFPPYNAVQIKDILFMRERSAFKKGVVEENVIHKCAAYAAREHGDARRAIELLRIAGEIAEREGAKKVIIDHLDAAEKKIEKDTVLTLVETQPKQHQFVLYAILAVMHDKKSPVLTGQVYEFYNHLCSKTVLRPLTQRRVSDIIGEFEMLGIINASVISKGRFGRTREINVSIAEGTLPKVHELLEKAIGI